MSEILFELQNGTGTITLNRPEKLNAFAGSMRERLHEQLERCEEDDLVRVVVITGAGRAFCAGGDVPNMSRLRSEGDVDGFRALLTSGARIVQKIRSMQKPVIAAVNGVAAGAGCNLALACDYRIAAAGATLGQTFVRIGLAPDWGGTWLLPRLVGASRAFELAATGRMVPADEALRIGLVDALVEDDALEREVRSFTEGLAGAAPLALAAIKQSISGAAARSLDQQLAIEERQQLDLFVSRDVGEGLAAFAEKRRAEFEGR